MILLLIFLLSLSAIYFTRLLTAKNMRAAAVSVAVLYIYLVAWTYAVFILDIADLGFSSSETRMKLLHGSDIYHSFVNLTDKMSAIPLVLLEAIVVVAVVILSAGFIVAFHGLFEITKAVINAAKEKTLFFEIYHRFAKCASASTELRQSNIIRLYCRMNC